MRRPGPSRRLGVVLAAVGALAGCSASPGGPPPIRYGESACAECRMIINEARYAAAALTEAGDAARFDSIECLARSLRQERPPPAQMWVHDYEQDRWLAAAEAFYVVSPALRTPMGQGIVAVATASDAARLAGQVHGRVVRFAQLRGV
ncbi:MAG: nitrous oxide reductase accessory protein NosL [Candidatus Omnitrophica bacterium]|nr:nitrous oxide reductase accessory protein NosL [Candidatus Omnitrophota bacterium]